MGLATRGGIIEDWSHFDPFHIWGVKPQAMNPPAGAAGTGRPAELGDGLAGAAQTMSLLEVAGDTKPWHPDHPLFWFGLLASVTFGLVAAATSVRVGPVRAGFSAGKQ